MENTLITKARIFSKINVAISIIMAVVTSIIFSLNIYYHWVFLLVLIIIFLGFLIAGITGWNINALKKKQIVIHFISNIFLLGCWDFGGIVGAILLIFLNEDEDQTVFVCVICSSLFIYAGIFIYLCFCFSTINKILGYNKKFRDPVPINTSRSYSSDEARKKKRKVYERPLQDRTPSQNLI